MIKIYVDWNVMSGMKNGYFPELSKILEGSDKFLVVYSTSHIGDIFVSYSDRAEQQEVIRQDLDYITSLTKNLCLANDSKMVNIHQYDPHELLQDRVDEKHLFEDLSLDNLFKPVDGDDQLNAVINNLKQAIRNLPLDALFKDAFDHPETAEMLNKLFPGLKEEPTMEGFFKSFGRMYHNLNETEDYKHLREMVQKVGVNSSHFGPDKNPFKQIEGVYEKSGINPDQYTKKGDHAPEWFDEITNEYLKLDLHGFKADKVKVTEKSKSTFRNTTEDASHSAFASRCEIYITNDDRNYHKTLAVYDKLQIYTKVLKPQDFMDYYDSFLNVHGFDEHLQNLVSTMKQQELFRTVVDEDGTYFGNIAYPNQYFFNFFNKITLPKSDDDASEMYFLISKTPSANFYIITQDEIAGMVDIFVSRLGPDVDGKTKFDRSEMPDSEWEGRRWNMDFGELRLRRLNGWFQLYFYMAPLADAAPPVADKQPTFFRRIFNFLKKRNKINTEK